MSERWAINASPIILLSKVGVIDLLPRACEELVMPHAEVAEVSAGEEGDAGRRWLATLGAPFVVESPPLPAPLRDTGLGRGEAEVLAWTLTHAGFKAVLDDRRGRIWAMRLNLSLIGSLGAVVFLKRRGLLPIVRPVLEQIRAAGGFVSAAAIQAALVEAGES